MRFCPENSKITGCEGILERPLNTLDVIIGGQRYDPFSVNPPVGKIILKMIIICFVL